MTEREQLALDPLVSPALIFPGHALNQRDDGVLTGRPADAVGRGPFFGDQATMPAQDRAGVTNRCLRSICGSLRTSPANTARSAHSRQGFGLALRSTATSWRRTKSSTSLDADERVSNISRPTNCRKIR